jgi:methionine--tRNA ligase beta chain
VTLDEFKGVELRVAKVLSAERVEGSEKLVKLQIDLGGEPRQIVAGIGKAYAPEDLVGEEIIVVANLEPRQLMGLESQGMLLAAHGEDSEPVLLVPKSPVPPGSKVS